MFLDTCKNVSRTSAEKFQSKSKKKQQIVQLFRKKIAGRTRKNQFSAHQSQISQSFATASRKFLLTVRKQL